MAGSAAGMPAIDCERHRVRRGATPTDLRYARRAVTHLSSQSRFARRLWPGASRVVPTVSDSPRPNLAQEGRLLRADPALNLLGHPFGTLVPVAIPPLGLRPLDEFHGFVEPLLLLQDDGKLLVAMV